MNFSDYIKIQKLNERSHGMAQTPEEYRQDTKKIKELIKVVSEAQKLIKRSDGIAASLGWQGHDTEEIQNICVAIIEDAKQSLKEYEEEARRQND